MSHAAQGSETVATVDGAGSEALTMVDGARSETVAVVDAPKSPAEALVAVPVTAARRGLRWWLHDLPLAALWSRYALAVVVYLASRAALWADMAFNAALRQHPVFTQLSNWDGVWYSLVAATGYPTHPVVGQSTLGFFPLYPLVIRGLAQPLAWLTGQPLMWSIVMAGALISTVGGLVTVVLVQKLATGWWGEASGRRAAVIFCLFPGSVIFSMVYAEGLMLPLVAGCLLALGRRRWLWAGILAALATATEPEAVVLVAACALAAANEFRRRGEDGIARRPLLAPLLSLTGIGAFALFLWAWTGTPMATMQAQRTGWQEKSDPLALVHLAQSLLAQVSFSHFNHPTINLNLIMGLLGAVVLVVLLVLVARSRRTLPAAAIAWTVGISLLAVTSEYVPPNPRLLISAFPAVLVLGRYLQGRWFSAAAALNALLLVLLSALTFVGSTLRP